MKQKIKCPNCEYEWETKSKLKFITCPCCLLKSENPDFEKQKEEIEENETQII